MIEEGAYQHVLPGEASVDERGDVPEDSSSASVGLFRGPEHVDELVHEGRHRPAAAPPRALGVSSARARRRGRHLGLFSPETPPRLVDRPVARLPRRLFALRTERAREQTRRSPFERPTAGGCRPSVADPAPLTRGFSQPRRQDPAVHQPTVGAYPRLRLAHRPRGVPLSPGSQAQAPVSSLARVTQRPTDAVSDRRLSRHCPQRRCTASLSLGAARFKYHRFCGGRSSVGIFFRDIIANVNMSTRF